MAEKPAVNASPLIFLAFGDLLNLLKIAGDEVVVPAAVAEEIQQRGPDDPTVQAIEKTTWVAVVPTPPIHSRIQAWDLGPGESSVLTLGYIHKGTEVIVDDLAARRCGYVPVQPSRGQGIGPGRRIVPGNLIQLCEVRYQWR